MYNFRDATRLNKGNSAYLELKNALINYEFKPGLQLRVESLAERFRASVTPIREALIRLHAEGFIVTQAGRGFFTKPLEYCELAARYKFAHQILRGSISEHPAAFSMEDVKEVRAARAPVRIDAQNSAWNASCYEETFMLAIAAMSNNVVVSDAIESFNEHTRYFRVTDFDMHHIGTEMAGYLQLLSVALSSHNYDDAMCVLKREFDLKLARMAPVIRECNARAFEDMPSGQTAAVDAANDSTSRDRRFAAGPANRMRYPAYNQGAPAR